VAAKGGKAFVLEGLGFPPQVQHAPEILALVDREATMTRMSTIISATQLTDDAQLDAAAPADVPRTLVVSAGVGGAGTLAFALLFLGRGARRRRWRPTISP
jgi:hypothetical protein